MTDLFSIPVNLYQERVNYKRPDSHNRKPDPLDPNYQLRYSNAFMQMCNGRARRVVDVGANVGLMTDRYKQWADAVESFEPITTLCRPEWHNVALSNTVGKMTFFLCNEPALSRLSPNGTNQADGELVSVPVTTLDSYGWTDVDAIKIDVEGFELEVIQGGQETISRCSPVIQAELMNHKPLIAKNKEVVKLLTGWGYQAFDYKHNPLGTEWVARPKDSDWFFKKI